MRLPIILLAVAITIYLVLHGVLLPMHLGDESWPMHAQNHVLRAAFLGVGTCVVAHLILFIPFRRRERWAWWAMLVIAIFTVGGFWAAAATVDFSNDDEWSKARMMFVVEAILFALGLLLSYPKFRSDRSDASS